MIPGFPHDSPFYLISIGKRSFFDLTASISDLVCATYSSTSPHNPLILTHPEESPYGQPSLTNFSGKCFLSGQKILVSELETASFTSGVSGWKLVDISFSLPPAFIPPTLQAGWKRLHRVCGESGRPCKQVVRQ